MTILLSVVDTDLEVFLEGEKNDSMLDVFMNRYPDIDSEEPIEGQLEAILEAQRSITTSYEAQTEAENILDYVLKKEFKSVPSDVKTDFQKGMNCPTRTACLKAMKAIIKETKQ